MHHLSVTLVLSAGLAACGGGSSADDGMRRFVQVEWDTTLVVGVVSPEDTTLLNPSYIRARRDYIYVADSQTLRAIRKTDGLLEWSYGSEGEGPGEIGNITDIQAVSEDEIWLLDARNAKLLRLTASGELIGETPLSNLPNPASRFIALPDSILLMGQFPLTAWMWIEWPGSRLLSAAPYPWPDDLGYEMNLAVRTAVGFGRNTWVAAFALGPGMIVGNGDSIRTTLFVEPVSFALKSGPHVRAAGADSARFAASAVSIVGDEIYVLFGGRPFRRAHPPEPTHIVDVYSLDGSYRRSYDLPVEDAWHMDTSDGQTFYVLAESDSLPFLLGLQASAK